MNKRKVSGVILLILAIGVGGFVIYSYTPAKPMAEALAALESDADVIVTATPWYIFRSAAGNLTKGFIIYPGGRVDPRTYAPAANLIATAGYLVIIAPMPLNLAVFGVNKAEDVLETYPDIHIWAVGGHSLGGAMAAQFISGNPSDVQGLVLWASFSASDISAVDIKVISIAGSVDGLSTPEKIQKYKANLPTSTEFIEIQGADHAQFGWYGDQSGDNTATITRETQQAQIVNATVNFLG